MTRAPVAVAPQREPAGLASLRRAVREGGGRLTPTTEAVYQFLLSRPGPVALEQIAAGCRKLLRKPPHTVSLYRITHRLEELGFVHKVALGDGIVRYEASDIGHHHHVVCTVCGRIVELDLCGMEVVDKYVREVLQFNHLTHSLEYRGVCAECVPAHTGL
jgi:Fe2+ or Zn2+ uptake regulation protein